MLRATSVLIAGAGGSIGAAIARHFAAQGASLMLADRELEHVARVAADITAAGGRAAAQRCDVTRAEDIDAAVAGVLERYGALNVVVGCAAADAPSRRVVDLPPDDWRHTIEVNLTGSFLLCRAAVPHMIAQGGGTVILLASQLGHVGAPARAAYCASKGGLIQLARTLALEHAADGIRINTLSPGAVESDRLRRHYGSDEAAAATLGGRHPIGRLGTPDEVAVAALFLADPACGFMTGADLLVDGGYTAA